MSRRDSSNTKSYRKPKTDIYTVMLLLAFLAIVIGCILLYMDVSDYGQSPTSGVPSASVLPIEQPGLGASRFAAFDGSRAYDARLEIV